MSDRIEIRWCDDCLNHAGNDWEPNYVGKLVSIKGRYFPVRSPGGVCALGHRPRFVLPPEGYADQHGEEWGHRVPRNCPDYADGEGETAWTLRIVG